MYEQARLGATLASLTAPPVEVHHGPHYTMPLRSKLPCVVTVHDLTFFDHPEWHERSKVAWFRAATRYSARHAAAIVCVSEATAERLGELLAPRCPVVVVAHGVDGDRFAAEEPRPGLDRQVLARLGLDRPYVLHLGTMEPRKGIADLVAAFERLAGDRTDLELVLAGGVGWGGGPVMQSIAASRAGGRIRRLGYVADGDVPALLRGASVVAYPSLEEGFGLPALEALACGAPLVTTAGTPMAAIAGDSALVVPAGQPVRAGGGDRGGDHGRALGRGCTATGRGVGDSRPPHLGGLRAGTSRDLPARDGALTGRPRAADSLNLCAPT